MHNDENGVVFGDVRSHVHAGSASPDATLGAPGAVREGRLKSRDELAREVVVIDLCEAPSYVEFVPSIGDRRAILTIGAQHN